jgi:hypothetical protein
MRTRVWVGIAVTLFVILQWLRWPEPLGIDQSLFALYGRWVGRGLALYRDLWDSKPPGIFALYAFAGRLAGATHAAWLLDLGVAVATAVLAAKLVLESAPAATAGAGTRVADRDRRIAAAAAALCGAFLWSAPVFGGPLVAGQAESCMAPLLLGAALCASRRGARSAFVCGVLLGAAATLKLVALFAVPVAWLYAPHASRRDERRTVMIAAGIALPLAVAVVALAARGVLYDAIQAVLVYPRAYAAEIASRSTLAGVLARGGTRLLRGIPVGLFFAAAGALAWRSDRRVTPALVWLGLAAAGIAVQRQVAGYHLLFLAPPLCILSAAGAPRVVHACGAAWQATQARSLRGTGALTGLVLVLALATAVEARLWVRQYTPHVAHRAGRIDRATFLRRLGGPGPLWAEAEAVAESIRATRRDATATAPAGTTGESMLVWGLAPSLYLLGDCRPATRYAFHQTFYVPDSPLSWRWPDATARRNELLALMQRDPPRWIAVVRGDRSGLEAQDSAQELRAFPALALQCDRDYEVRAATPSYTLLLRKPPH